jgi:hypothetical protein
MFDVHFFLPITRYRSLITLLELSTLHRHSIDSPLTLHRKSIDNLPEAIDARSPHGKLSSMADMPTKVQSVPNTDRAGATPATARRWSFSENQNRTKPDETPPSPQNGPLFINNLQQQAGHGRPVLLFKSPCWIPVTQRPPNDSLPTVCGNLTTSLGNPTVTHGNLR